MTVDPANNSEGRSANKQRLGLLEDPEFVLTDAFWAPLSDEECGFSEGEDMESLSPSDEAGSKGTP